MNKNPAAVSLGKKSAQTRKKKLGKKFNKAMSELVKKRWEKTKLLPHTSTVRTLEGK